MPPNGVECRMLFQLLVRVNAEKVSATLFGTFHQRRDRIVPLFVSRVSEVL